jgi:hypothetical protein
VKEQCHISNLIKFSPWAALIKQINLVIDNSYIIVVSVEFRKMLPKNSEVSRIGLNKSTFLRYSLKSKKVTGCYFKSSQQRV